MAARAADRAPIARSGWSVPSNEDAAHTSSGEAGGAAAEELSRWLAQVLVEERRALRSALERSHRDSRAALDEELGRRHGALAAQLRERCQARHARGGPECLPGVPSESKPAGPAGHATPSSTPRRPTGQSHLSVEPPVVVLQQYAARRAAPGDDDTDQKDGPEAIRSADTLVHDVLSPTSRSEWPVSEASSEYVQRRVNTVLFQQKEHDVRQRWAEFVEGARFETFMAFLIMLNGLQMALEVQHVGLIRGYDLGYRDYAKSPDPWQGADKVWEVLGIFFGVVFTCEVSLKIAVLRCKFFKSCWNLFDLFVVLCFLLESSAAAQASLGDTTALRLARLARLLRLVRVVRQIHSFDTLFLMTTALQSSAYVLAWSGILLFIIQAMVAFSINQLLEEFYFGGDHPQQEQEEVFEYFGSFSRALLSTFEMTLANWPPVCRLLMENVSEWFMVICLLHKLTVGFAVVGIINGVFIQETFRTAAQDDFIMMHQKESAARTHQAKMERLFQTGDASGDGLLDRDEFLQLTQNAEVKMWLSSMGLDAGDGAALFHFMDVNNDGNVSIAELIEGVTKLKGGARSLDLHTCLKKQDELYQALSDVHLEVGQRLQAFTSGRASADLDASASAGDPVSPCTVISAAWGDSPGGPRRPWLPDAPRGVAAPKAPSCRLSSVRVC